MSAILAHVWFHKFWDFGLLWITKPFLNIEGVASKCSYVFSDWCTTILCSLRIVMAELDIFIWHGKEYTSDSCDMQTSCKKRELMWPFTPGLKIFLLRNRDLYCSVNLVFVWERDKRGCYCTVKVIDFFCGNHSVFIPQ